MTSAEPAESHIVTRFDRDTAVARIGPDRYAARLARRWQVGRGENGGYLGAVLLRALSETVGDPTRRIRSLTIHYPGPAVAGPAEVSCRIEHRGRSLTSVSARMDQEGRTVSLALGEFVSALPSPIEHDDLRAPAIAAPEQIEPLDHDGTLPAFTHQFEHRFAHGAALHSRNQQAESGGWLRLRETRRADALLVTALTDAWLPALFVATPERMAVPTIDLTVHFRRRPESAVLQDGNVHVLFSTRLATDGFCEEDGLLWDSHGALIAQSRQLALVQPTVA